MRREKASFCDDIISKKLVLGFCAVSVIYLFCFILGSYLPGRSAPPRLSCV